jgi:hypothetical protein
MFVEGAVSVVSLAISEADVYRLPAMLAREVPIQVDLVLCANLGVYSSALSVFSH